MENKKRIASISIIVILIAATLGIVATVLNNGSTPVGPDIPTSGIDISVASTPVVQSAQEINYIDGTICATDNGSIADVVVCDPLTLDDIELRDSLTFVGDQGCVAGAEQVTRRFSGIIDVCSDNTIELFIDNNNTRTDSCMEVIHNNTSSELFTVCEDSGATSTSSYTASTIYSFTGTSGCTTSSENIGVSATANIEICSRDNVRIIADSNDNGGFSCVSFRKNGTLSDMGKFCEDSGLTTVDEFRMGPGTNTCLDSGDGNPGSLTVEPTNSTKLVTNNDPHGCDIDIAETDATSGQIIYLVIVSDSSSLIAYPDIAGQQETDGSLSGMAVWSSVEFIYASDRWVQTSAAFN